jgi:nucleotide-binding universal stress UspA family protein
MTTILCATRGGEASYPNQDLAIALAKERNADLLFIYVTDVQFLDRLASPVLVDMETEMDRLAEFLLLMAKERAEKASVNAETIVRRGDFRAALEEVAKEHEVSLIVWGSPAGETSITRQEYLEHLAEDVWADTAIETLLVHEGEIIAHHP